MTQVIDKIDQLNVTAKMESIEAQVTDIVEEKIKEAVRETHEIVKESYASVVNKGEVSKKKTMSQPTKERNISLSHNIEMNLEYKRSQKIQTKLANRILSQHMNM